MAAKRCQAAGCGRFVKPEASWCRKHSAGGLEPLDTDFGGLLDERSQDLAAFRERLRSGKFAELLDEWLRVAIDQAAEIEGLNFEIGAMRTVLARVLAVEQDPVRLAQSSARVVNTIVQAMRTKQGMRIELQQFQKELERVLHELENDGVTELECGGDGRWIPAPTLPEREASGEP